MKFFCQQFPFLRIKLGDGLYAQFENGELETEDSRIIGRLKQHKWYGKIITEGKPVEWVEKIIEKSKNFSKRKRDNSVVDLEAAHNRIAEKAKLTEEAILSKNLI